MCSEGCRRDLALGVAVGLRGYGMCQPRGAIRRSTLLKNAKGRMFWFSIVSVLIFSKSKLSRAAYLSPREIFVGRVSPIR